MTLVSNQLHSIIGEILGVDPESLQADTRVRSLPKADSMHILQIILKVEKIYGIEIPDTVTFNIETVGQFEQLIHTLLEQNQAKV